MNVNKLLIQFTVAKIWLFEVEPSDEDNYNYTQFKLMLGDIDNCLTSEYLPTQYGHRHDTQREL